MNEALTDIPTAVQVGQCAGQISMGEYIMAQFSDEVSPRLERFIQRVITSEYQKMEEICGIPSEDIALAVSKIIPK